MADFTGDDLRSSRFERVDLTGAEFRAVDLSHSRFRGVDLSGVVMRGVELVGARIDGEIIVTVVAVDHRPDVQVAGQNRPCASSRRSAPRANAPALRAMNGPGT